MKLLFCFLLWVQPNCNKFWNEFQSRIPEVPKSKRPKLYQSQTLSNKSPSPISVVELPVSPQRKRHYSKKNLQNTSQVIKKADQRDVYLSKSVAALGDGRSILTDPLESMPNVYTLSKNSPSPISVVELPISPQRKRHYCQKTYKLHPS